MKSVLTIFLIIWSIHMNHSYSMSFLVSDGGAVFQVQDREMNSLPKRDLPADHQKKTSGNIVESPILSVKLAFMADPRLFPYDIDCQVKEKTVELTGVVSLEDEKSLATRITASFLHGKEIINHIEVNPALLATIQHTVDTRLTESVKQRFAASQTLRDANFEVVAVRGVISLSGQTRFQVIALEAAQAAREIPGVIAVNTQDIRLEADND
ncbi:MAG: BON domain-containing protein [Nitrospirales bacterium]|nr:BON domain-containing protein [Nitrospirales bacterium]